MKLKLESKEAFLLTQKWFASKNWKIQDFQLQTWQAVEDGKNGLLNAPTGSGKTFALLFPFVFKLFDLQKINKKKPGLTLLWITPVRALSYDISNSAKQAIEALQLKADVGIRNGDTDNATRQKQKKAMPEFLITTPESLHLLLAQKNHEKVFENLQGVVVDEWHELLSSKRGVQVELALSRLRGINKNLQTWGISATIGNLQQAAEVLNPNSNFEIIRYKKKKEIIIESILPDDVEKFPWAGHLGIRLLDKILPIIEKNKSTLIFTNTRAQTEIWYRNILEKNPDLAGLLAMHHSSLSKEIRNWVEDALHENQLKAVVCTSGLDLGVDFRPVDGVIQIGSPKGIARFVQRAGRSGHSPDLSSKIYFLPTHALELIEAAALRKAIEEDFLEERSPFMNAFDVLVQYLMTLAVGDGFYAEKILHEVINTHCFSEMSDNQWQQILIFLTNGGEILENYEEYHKVVVEEGIYKVKSKREAMRHRMSIGTIVSDAQVNVKYIKGSFIGTVEEWFVSKFKVGDAFWFSGKALEIVKIKDNNVLVKNSKQTKLNIPAWMGGRMPLSSNLSEMLRKQIVQNENSTKENESISTLLNFQKQRSHLPNENEILIESVTTKEGFHLFVFPFEGRYVNEGIAGLLAYRLSLLKPISFSIAMNDYGFELLSDQEIDVQSIFDNNLFTTEHLMDDLKAGINAIELAKRKFRDIAAISGLIFKGFPGKYIKDKHLLSSSQLLFEVFYENEPNHFLIQQAIDEALYHELDFFRLKKALERINQQNLVIKTLEKPSPFSFPIMVDRLRERLSSEKLADRIQKMSLQFD